MTSPHHQPPHPTGSSAAPVRPRGTRSRAGNAMGRTRAAVVAGALRAVERHGSKHATMGDIASLAGVAKATLYNHFRTKSDVYDAVLEASVAALAEECGELAAQDVTAALTHAADRLAGHGALRRLAADEPAVLASLVSIGDAPPWQQAREGVRDVLAAADCDSDPASVETVLRWLLSFAATPADRTVTAAGASCLAAGLCRAG